MYTTMVPALSFVCVFHVGGGGGVTGEPLVRDALDPQPQISKTPTP